MKKETFTKVDNIMTIALFMYVVILPAFMEHNRTIFLVIVSVAAIEKLIYIYTVNADISRRKYWFNVGFEVLILVLVVLSFANVLPLSW